MKTMRSGNWFRKMGMLALLAVFGLVASPVFAANCCCDDMAAGTAEIGHSHSSPASASHDHDTEQQVQPNISAALLCSSISENCQHAQCEIAPLVIGNERNQAPFFAPLFALNVQIAFQTPRVSRVSVFASRVAKPRAPDPAFCSGLSPPASSRS